MAIKSKLVYYTDNHGAKISFADQFINFLTKMHHDKEIPIKDNQKLLGRLVFIEYYTTTVVVNYLGLTYEEFCNLPTKDPDKLKMIFDLGEIVHRLINAEVYEWMAGIHEEKMKERAEWRKKVFGKK
jgi:hypothetical protein